ncbi:hypothetical protein FQN60_002543 [Etheostoma spectabile]|uniref:Uncharacterized protein n=1 Tax=Etheostoma spectabile TaxID=54343 RepID=A0A5J5C8T3_9PERO|nr:hypothetical protein FQN60_002543 [Etheostoma spectabile]
MEATSQSLPLRSIPRTTLTGKGGTRLYCKELWTAEAVLGCGVGYAGSVHDAQRECVMSAKAVTFMGATK